MKKAFYFTALAVLVLFFACKTGTKNKKNMQYIAQQTVDSVVAGLTEKYGSAMKVRISKGVSQAAALWTETDGSGKDFRAFCLENFVGDSAGLDELFGRLQQNFEVLYGNYNQVSVSLKEPLHIDKGNVISVDEIFGAYDPFAHLNDDFFTNKLAFICILNFPFYTLKEKAELSNDWTRKQWAYARLGDMFKSRVPAEVLQKFAETYTLADTYISGYNIFMGNLRNDQNNALFPTDLKLISHWGLRDELKANYNAENGLEKQKMIYQVMLRIINQDIPDSAVNNPGVEWNPYSNKVMRKGNEVKCKAEADIRYTHLLSLFQALQEIDQYNPQYPTYIQRKFEQEMEMPQPEVENLFVEFVSSPQVKEVAKLITKRLNRDLQPFDIWYDGFKPRSSISQEELDSKVKAKYPDIEAFSKDLPGILIKLQFVPEKADEITSRITVDPSRGAGHAWGAMMKGDKARLRTRIPAEGMNYKGYNIAIHEFGHNVEQTLSLYDMDFYMLNGVPNTAFTEALAFIFQKRDLELLGIKNADPDKSYYMTLDNFWSLYEIMGVSLVDMNVWKWLYEHPDASPQELKQAVTSIAKDIWNKYYADVFGVKDSPILAVYSHMIDNPLYLSAYPLGHIIEFQIEEYIKDKHFAAEVIRIYTLGRLTPDVWMKQAVGQSVSIKPVLNATDEALKKVGK